jgi:hypothetical protein
MRLAGLVTLGHARAGDLLPWTARPLGELHPLAGRVVAVEVDVLSEVRVPAARERGRAG